MHGYRATAKGSAIAGAALFVFFVARRMAARFATYEVRGQSMAPTLNDGDFVILDRQAYRRRFPLAGEVVVLADPRDPAREMVKRVRTFDPVDGAWVEGDAPGASTDSRTFGRVSPRLIVGRVRVRYYPRPRVI